MAFRKRFVVSNEDVNSHGFVTLTNGIDLTGAKQNCPAFYDHNYWRGTVGHWEDIRKDGVNLTADFVCEGITDAEKEIIKKIEVGDIKGASIGADAKAWSEEPIYLKTGQTRPTLTKCDLFEISLTPIPSNKSALCLKRDGQPVLLTAATDNMIPNFNTKKNMKAIAIKLGLNENATEGEIIEAVGKIQLSQKNNEAFTKEIMSKASEGLNEHQKEIFEALGTVGLSKAIQYADGVKDAGKDDGVSEDAVKPVSLQKDVKVSNLINQGKNKQTDEADGKQSFDYLSKHNSVELKRIATEEPEKYTQLVRDYQKGVRYNSKTA